MLAELTQFADAAIRAQKNYQKVYSAETEEKYDAKMSLLYGKVDEVLAACPQYKVAIIAQLHRGCN
jgi:hypothetical protein